MSPKIHRREVVAGALALSISSPAVAQQPRPRRIAFLSTFPPSDQRYADVLGGLRDYGWVEGRTVTVDYFIARDFAELPGLAQRAVASQPDLIVAVGALASLAAKDATATIPIVFSSGNPIEVGLIASLARPGGNLTGVTTNTSLIAAKQLEVLKEIVPGMTRVAIFLQPDDPSGQVILTALPSAGMLLGVQILVVEVKSDADLEPMFAVAATNGAQGALFIPAGYFAIRTARIAELGARHRLPTMLGDRRLPQEGGLVSYSADLAANYRRMAYFIDRIFKGAAPADLPVEAPIKYLMVINAKTAKALGIEIPFLVLARADEVIE
jgi:putative tryptophan/tyrosine transport system substrate-binding protein